MEPKQNLNIMSNLENTTQATQAQDTPVTQAQDTSVTQAQDTSVTQAQDTQVTQAQDTQVTQAQVTQAQVTQAQVTQAQVTQAQVTQAQVTQVTQAQDTPVTSAQDTPVEVKDVNSAQPSYIQGLVSVIIPTYNRFAQLLIAINSALSQTYKHLEIIVVDDCSTQPEYAYLKSIYSFYPNVKIIHLPQNLREKYNVKAAQGKTRNHGASEAKGEYLAFLDDDDAFCDSQKIEKQVEYITNYPNIGLVCTNVYFGHGPYSDTIAKTKLFTLRSSTDNYPHYEDLNRLKCLDLNIYLGDINVIRQYGWNFMPNSTVLVKHKLYDLVGGQDFGICEDFRCWTKVLEHCNAIYWSVPTIYYDQNHGGKTWYN